jgi:hypothetical protein
MILFERIYRQILRAYVNIGLKKDPEEYDPSLKKWPLTTILLIPKQFELKVVEDKGIRKVGLIINRRSPQYCISKSHLEENLAAALDLTDKESTELDSISY